MYSRLSSTPEVELKKADSKITDDSDILNLFPSQLWEAMLLPYMGLDELANIAHYLPNLTLKYLNYDAQQVKTLINFAELKRRKDFLEAQQAVMADFADHIEKLANARHATLQDKEDNRPIKKSTWATVCSLLPGVTLIPASVIEFLAAKKARAVAERLISTVFYPTCTNDFTRVYTEDMFIGTIMVQGEAFTSYSDTDDHCKLWRDQRFEYGQYKYGCDYSTCMDTMKFIDDNVNKNNEAGNWLVGVGIAAVLIASILYCCKKRWKGLNQINLEDILKTPFQELANEDLRKTIRRHLEIDHATFSSLTVSQVITQLRKKNATINNQFNKLMTSSEMKMLETTLQTKTKIGENKAKTEAEENKASGQQRNGFFQSKEQNSSSSCTIDMPETNSKEEQQEYQENNGYKRLE